MVDKTLITDTDNFSVEYKEFFEERGNREREQRAIERLGEEDSSFSLAPDSSVDLQTENINPDSSQDTTGMTITKNIIEALPQAGAGVIDAANEVIGIIDDLANTLVDVGIPDKIMVFRNPKTGKPGINFLTPAEAQAFRIDPESGLPKLPIGAIVTEPDTTTGKIGREISKFLTTMVPTVKAIQAVRATAGARATFTEVTAGSALASFVFQDHQVLRVALQLQDLPPLWKHPFPHPLRFADL